MFYFLKKIRQDIFSKSYGGAQPNISSKTIENYEILFPNKNLLPKIIKKLDEIIKIIDKNKQSFYINKN